VCARFVCWCRSSEESKSNRQERVQKLRELRRKNKESASMHSAAAMMANAAMLTAAAAATSRKAADTADTGAGPPTPKAADAPASDLTVDSSDQVMMMLTSHSVYHSDEVLTARTRTWHRRWPGSTSVGASGRARTSRSASARSVRRRVNTHFS
jgi:hypothetical protein